jgi:probable HAF family extracellular repeat protein
MVDVGYLNSVTPTSESRGTSGVNNSGQVAGDCTNAAGATHACLYSGGSLYDLGCLGSNASKTSRAYAINAGGEACGLSLTTTDTYDHIFLWNPTSPNATTGTMYDLGGLGSGGAVLGNGYALAMNDYGQVTGIALAGRGTGSAFLWTPTTPGGTTGSMIDIGIQLTGVSNVFGESIGSNGAMAGYGTVGSIDHPFVWTPSSANGTSGTMVDLYSADPTDFGTQSRAFGVNKYGMVVGSSGNGVNAFLYYNGAYTNLYSLINPSLGWTALNYAESINDSGQITGWGTYNGNTEPFLLQVPVPTPEPSTLLLATAGLAGLLAYAWRKRK